MGWQGDWIGSRTWSGRCLWPSPRRRRRRGLGRNQSPPRKSPTTPPTTAGSHRRIWSKIVNFEVGSIRYYNRYLTTPLEPLNEASGLTIGVGYDLGYVTPDEIQNDWQGFLSGEDIQKLCKVSGLRGWTAKQAHRGVVGITIPYEVALKQFTKVTLPRWIMKTYQTFPNFDNLNVRQKTALVSLVFNRGTSLKGRKRDEMQAIHDNLARGNTRPVAGLIKAMAQHSPLKGVQKRRVEEAELFAS